MGKERGWSESKRGYIKGISKWVTCHPCLCCTGFHDDKHAGPLVAEI